MPSKPGSQRPKEVALGFLKLVIEGQIDRAYDEFVDPLGKHHNIFTEAGFGSLKKGMREAHAKSPNKRFQVKQVLEDGDLVAIHSHLTLNPEMDLAAVHLFKVKDGKIIEMWDCAQPISPNSPNKDGAF